MSPNKRSIIVKSHILFCILFGTGIAQVYCQDAIGSVEQEKVKKNQIGIELGSSFGYLKDLNFSPLNYQDRGLFYALRYQRKNKKAILSANLRYGHGSANNKLVGHFKSDYIVGGLDANYLRKINLNSTKKISLFLGGQYRFQLFYLNWDDGGSISFSGNHGFSLSARLDYELSERHHFSASLNLPFINLIVRPPYNNFDEELFYNSYYDKTFKLITDGYWGSLNKLIATDLTLTYTCTLSDRLNLTPSYRLAYYNTNEKNKFTHLSNHFALGLSVNF